MATDNIGAEIYQSVEENPTPVYAEITGSIPQWIEGKLLRVGPGKFEWGDDKYNHWFDGDAILNRFEIKDGKVQFSSRFLRSSSYVESERRGCIAFSQFGTVAPPDPCQNIFARFFSYFTLPEMTDNCNVNVVKIKGNILASTETTRMWEFDENTLETVTRVDVAEKLSGPRSWTAHPHYDNDGNYYNISVAFVKSVFQVIKIPGGISPHEAADEGLEVISTVPYKSSPAYFHSFAVTENYFVFYQSSLFMAHPVKLLMMKIMNWSYVDMFYFDENVKSKLYLIEKKSGKVAGVFSVDAFMCFHQINAYEKGNEVVFDMCGYPDAAVMKALYLSTLRCQSQSAIPDIRPPEVRRYRLPLKGVSTDKPVHLEIEKNELGVDYESIYMNLELPRINYEKYNGREYSFVYGMGDDEEFGLTNLIKLNVKTKESLEWKEKDCLASEPVFLPSPNAETEDDGVILSSVLGLKGRKSFLLLLDAKTMNEIARAEVPCRLVPLIHGEFVN